MFKIFPATSYDFLVIPVIFLLQDKVVRPRNTKVIHRISTTADKALNATQKQVSIVLDDAAKQTTPAPPPASSTRQSHTMKHSVSSPMLMGAWSGRRLENAVAPQLLEDLTPAPSEYCKKCTACLSDTFTLYMCVFMCRSDHLVRCSGRPQTASRPRLQTRVSGRAESLTTEPLVSVIDAVSRNCE